MPQSKYHSDGEMKHNGPLNIAFTAPPFRQSTSSAAMLIIFSFITDLLGNGQTFLTFKGKSNVQSHTKNKYLVILYKNCIKDLPFTGI